MVWSRSAWARLGVDGVSPQLRHQALDTLMVEPKAEAASMGRHPRPAVKGRRGVRLGHAPQQPSVELGCQRWRVIERGTVQPDQLTRATETEVKSADVEHRASGPN
jgi:hypothetical protein